MQRLEFEWAWKKCFFESWELAFLADWAVTSSFDETCLLTTAVMNKYPDENKDFLPLTIDFRESYYAGWKIGWPAYQKREWRPSDNAILTARLTDRPIRPMFPSWMINDVVVTISPLVADRLSPIWVFSIISSSLAIMIAWIEFEWPVWAVRIWYFEDKLVVNPTYEQIENWLLDLVVAWTKDTITMVECGANQVSVDIVMQAFELAQKEIEFICDKQTEFLKFFELKKLTPSFNLPDERLMNYLEAKIDTEKLSSLMNTTKAEFEKKYEHYLAEAIADVKPLFDDPESWFTYSKMKIWYFKHIKKYLRDQIFDWKRQDGRSFEQVRPLASKVDFLPRIHWVGLFTRWETQVLSLTTLWAPWDVLLLDTMELDEVEKRFMHHYNMPPFATNEARSTRAPNRREIWHGRLAEKALEAVLPKKEDFPYAIRTVSEVLTSNGSSSMASVCAGCLSLMDAWVPISSPVSWVAMGLVAKEVDWKIDYRILTDIQGWEDFVWDMDFKVAWTEKWITALQMDMKVKGLPLQVIKKAIQQATDARQQILEHMLSVMPSPRENPKPWAPKITTIQLTWPQVREVIWTGWATIQEIIRQSWVKIDFDENNLWMITAKNEKDADLAMKLIKDIIWTPGPWDIVDWKITRVEAYWVFVSLGKKQGLAHIKNLSIWPVQPQAVFKIWDPIKVQIMDIDKDWKINLKKI